MAGFWASSWYAKQRRRQCRCRHPAWYWAQLTSHRLPLPECLWVCFKAHQIQDMLKTHLSRTLQFQDFSIYSDQPCTSFCSCITVSKWNGKPAMRHYATKCQQAPAEVSCVLIWLDFHLNTYKERDFATDYHQRVKKHENTVGAWLKHWKVRKNNCILPHKQALFGWDRFDLNHLCWKNMKKTSTWTSCHLAENHAPNLHVFHRPCPHVSGWWWAPHRKVHRRVSRWSSCRCPTGIADFPVEPPWGCDIEQHNFIQLWHVMAMAKFMK